MNADAGKDPRPAAPSSPTWLLLVRPVLILVCFILGCVALRVFVIRGSMLDTGASVKMSEDRVDLFEARNAVQRADFDGAIQILNHLLVKQPNYAEAHRMLGRIYLQMGDREKALKHYQASLRYWPGDEESQHAVEALSADTNRASAAAAASR